MSRGREGADVSSRPMRAALGNPDLVRFTIAHISDIVARRAMFVGALVYAFELGGAEATGAATIALLIAHAATVPYAGAVVRRRPNRVRLASFCSQAVVFGAAAAAAFASAPVFVIVGPCVIGVAALTFIRPASGAPGDRFFAVADGQFDVAMDGELIRTLGRGESFGEIALLTDVPRTATVTARDDGTLLAIEREPFLVAITGHDLSREAAWEAIRSLRLTAELREALPAMSPTVRRQA